MFINVCPFCGTSPQIFESQEKKICVVGCDICNIAVFDKDLETAVNRWRDGDFDE